MIVRHKNFTQAIAVFFGIFTVTVLLAKQAGQHTGGYTNHAASTVPTGAPSASRSVANDIRRPFRVFLVDQRQVTGATARQLRRISNKEVESVELIFYPQSQITGGLYFQAIHHKVSRSGNQDYVIGTLRADQPSNLPSEFLAPGREVIGMAAFEEIDRFTGLRTDTGNEVVGLDYENFRYGLGQLQLNYDCLWGDRVWVRNATSAAVTVAAAAFTYKLAKFLAGRLRPRHRGAPEEDAGIIRQVAARLVNFVHNTWGFMEFMIAAPMVGGVATTVYLKLSGWMDSYFFGSEHERVQRVRGLLTDAQASGGDMLRFANLALPYDTQRMGEVFNSSIEAAEAVRNQGIADGDSSPQIARDVAQAFNEGIDRGIQQQQAELEAQMRSTAPAFIRIPSDDLALDIQALHRFMTFYASRELASNHSRLVGGAASGAGQCAGYTELRHTLEHGMNEFRRALRDGVDTLTE